MPLVDRLDNATTDRSIDASVQSIREATAATVSLVETLLSGLADEVPTHCPC